MASIAKVIEVIAESNTMEGAMRAAVSSAGKSVRNIQGVYMDSVKGVVEDQKIVAFRVACKVTFIIDDE